MIDLQVSGTFERNSIKHDSSDDSDDEKEPVESKFYRKGNGFNNFGIASKHKKH